MLQYFCPCTLYLAVYSRASMVPLEIPLRMLEYLKAEESYIPWHEASSQINYLDVFLQETDVYDIYKVRQVSPERRCMRCLYLLLDPH